MLHRCLQYHCLFMRRERKKSELLMDVFCVSSFFCLHDADWVQWVLCLISMIHSMMLFLCLQYCCLLMRRERNRVSYWWMSFVCLSFVFTTQIEFNECCVWFQWFIQWRCSCVSNIVVCWWEEKWNGELLVDVFVCLLLYSLHRLRFVSVVFDSSASLNDVAPLSPILFPVDYKIKGKEWIVDGCLLCVFFVLTAQIEFFECCVWFQCFTQWCCSCFSNVVPC